MSTDPSDFMLNSDVYDQLIKDAEKDDRVGDHEALVQKVTRDKWPSGDPRQKIVFVLLTARNAKADLTWSKPPSPEEAAATMASWEPAKKKGVASAISIARQAVKEYGVAITADGYLDIREGQKFNVKTVKTRRDDEGGGGFIRIIAFLPKDRPVGEAATQAAASEAPAF